MLSSLAAEAAQRRLAVHDVSDRGKNEGGSSSPVARFLERSPVTLAGIAEHVVRAWQPCAEDSQGEIPLDRTLPLRDPVRHGRPRVPRGCGTRFFIEPSKDSEVSMRKLLIAALAARQGIVRALAHAGAIVLLYLAFSFALFLGLQVDPTYGSMGLVLAAALLAAYVYFGFLRRK